LNIFTEEKNNLRDHSY